MNYRFTADRDWTDYASGRVLRSGPGQTGFPPRLANEMFRICVDLCERGGRFGPYAVYDPCCGGATLLTVVGLMNAERIRRLVGSDVDGRVLETARNNLALLSAEGAAKRLREIEGDYAAYGKTSHREALASARRIVAWQLLPVSTAVLQLDATALREQDFDGIGQPDIVLADVPYGIESTWKAVTDDGSPVEQLLDSLSLISGKPVVAIAADKKSRVEHARYRRLKRHSIGRRQIVFLQKDDLAGME